MKIVKGIFKTSLEIRPEELKQFKDYNCFQDWYGLFKWIKDIFGLDILTKNK